MPFFFAPTRDKRAKANTVLAEHGLPPGTRCASLCRLKMRRKHPQVLGVDLNRSESRGVMQSLDFSPLIAPTDSSGGTFAGQTVSMDTIYFAATPSRVNPCRLHGNRSPPTPTPRKCESIPPPSCSYVWPRCAVLRRYCRRQFLLFMATNPHRVSL